VSVESRNTIWALTIVCMFVSRVGGGLSMVGERARAGSVSGEAKAGRARRRDTVLKEVKEDKAGAAERRLG
jgi:hypothetical protein